MQQRQQQQQQALSLYSQQLIQALGQVPGQIQSDYAGALSTTQALGQQGMAALQAANPNAANQALLSAIGAPQAQHETLQQQNQNVFGGGGAVLNYTGGVLPGQTFAQDQAARTAYARSLPEVQALSGRQALVQLLAGQGKESDALAQQIAQMRSDATRQAYGIQNQLATQDYRRQQAAALQAYRNQQLAVQTGKARTSAATAADLSKYRWASLQSRNQLALLAGGDKKAAAALVRADKLANQQRLQRNADRTYQLATVKYLTSLGKSAKTGKPRFTANQLAGFKDTAANTAADAFQGFHLDAKTGAKKPIDASQRTYQGVVAFMTDHGIPLQIAQAAANRYWRAGAPGAVVVRVNAPEKGYVYFPSRGETPRQGRPLVPYQRRPKVTPPFAADATPVQVIRTFAPRLGLDPAAVLAYALTQGGSSWGAVGDQGTSFGPFQAHQGGALGAHNEAWANSPEGLVELMRMMARAGARGRTGPEAAAFIVGPAFGRGAHPARDMANARAQYARALQLLGTV